MPIIKITTSIHAPTDLVFNLARSIDLHTLSVKHTNEKAIAGKTTGLISLGESVTWRAKHFRVYLTLTAKVTAFQKPDFFVDEMQKGIFKSFKHHHQFVELENGTKMIDTFEYNSPLGVLGKIADFIFLKGYMRHFLEKRNEVIKQYAETGQWKKIITHESN